jgi:CTP:molybdopterin cytidylyltransferase MocA
VSAAGLVLAAGQGRRYGMPKALVVRDGQWLVERALATLRDGGCEPVAVVLGAAADEVLAVADLGDALVVRNPEWPEGMGSSLRAGLAALAATPAECVAVLLVDTPGITPAAVRRVLRYAGPGALAAASYADRQGHPVLLGRRHWTGVAELATGDQGVRPYLALNQVILVDCDDVADDTDLDIPE